MKWALVFLIVVCNTCSDLLNTMGMRRYGEVHDFHPVALLRLLSSLLRNRFIVAGIFFMAISFFALTSLLSISRLSFAVPATAVNYVFETLLAKLVLGERIALKRWAGAAIVSCGVMLLAM